MDYNQIYAENHNYFGNPFPEILEFFESRVSSGSVLDIGCGQGRNAIPIAEMGFEVLAIDLSTEATDQLSKLTCIDNLMVECIDIADFEDWKAFDLILLDGFFHFYDHDIKKETYQFQFILNSVRDDALLVICFANHEYAKSRFEGMTESLRKVHEDVIHYQYIDPITELTFETHYLLVVLQK